MNALSGGVLLSALLLTSDPAVVAVSVPIPAADLAPLVPDTEPDEPDTFKAGHLPFSLTIRDTLTVDYATFAIFARPGEQVQLDSETPLSWIENGEARPPATQLDWTAPEVTGLTRVEIEDETGQTMALNLVVMRPRLPGEAATINGYELGSYPAEPYQGRENYRAPEYFLEVGSELADVAVSPHFRLGQFLCKQAREDGDEAGPQYMVLSERLLVKLERILEAANDRGWRTDGFYVMSGYRTPAYNASIGNGENSRHIFGGAADIFIDTDGDGVMDDLNGDGVNDRQDAAALFDLVESLSQDPAFAELAGGLGEYAPTAYHGPFVHVDERGWNVQWGRPTR